MIIGRLKNNKKIAGIIRDMRYQTNRKQQALTSGIVFSFIFYIELICIISNFYDKVGLSAALPCA